MVVVYGYAESAFRRKTTEPFNPENTGDGNQSQSRII